MRHAKSAWPDDVPDHERPLSGRGRRDAAAAGRWLHDQGVEPDVALVSSARRTQETMAGVGPELAATSVEVRPSDELYGAGAGDLLDAVRGVGAGHATVLVIAHNPGIGMLAAILDDGTGEAAAGGPDGPDGPGGVGYPTAATTVFEVPGPWADLDPGTARVVAFAVPRG